MHFSRVSALLELSAGNSPSCIPSTRIVFACLQNHFTTKANNQYKIGSVLHNTHPSSSDNCCAQSMLDKQMNELAQSRKQQPIVSEQQTYKRFLTVWSRQVQSPDGRVIDWDVAGHGTQAPAFATVFPYNSKKKTVRLLVEYAQGPNVMAYTFAAGGFDAKKHKNIQDTAESELSEEAKLRGGKWIRLIPPDHDGIPELKWSRNKFVPFLVIDPEDDIAPLSCDTEEYIEPLDISLDTLHTYILQGLVMLPSVQTALMATDWLRKNEYI